VGWPYSQIGQAEKACKSCALGGAAFELTAVAAATIARWPGLSTKRPEVGMKVAILVLLTSLGLSTVALGQPSDDDSSLMIGPWRIEVVMKGNKFDRCSMSRKADDDISATILRASDGLTLVLDSSKWKLERGKQYPVDLAIGSRRWSMRASADSDAVTIALADSTLVEMIRKANILEVRGEGSTIAVPLDKSMAALDRLETCLRKTTVRQKPIRSLPQGGTHRPISAVPGRRVGKSGIPGRGHLAIP
jgi:hypothetical protein